MVKKMLNNGNKTNCGFSDEIVAYIYDEIGTADRRKFETHLTDCSLCTDEFAEISNARFSIFEWKKQQFSHLSTPEIVIPYSQKTRVAEKNAAVEFLAGLRGLLSISTWPVAVAAALLLFLGVGIVSLVFIGRTGEQIAANDRNVPSVAVPEGPKKVELNPTIVETTPQNEVTKQTEIRPTKVIENTRSKPNRQLTADTQRRVNNIPERRVTPQVRNAPVLSPYDDNDDRSLRLSDLFDEVVGGL